MADQGGRAGLPRPPGEAAHLVVAGGGFAGVALAIHVLRMADRPVAVTLVEPRERLGRGLAYGTGDPEHRINVPSDKMALFPEDGPHFTRWLEATGERAADPAGEAYDGWHFGRRMVFGVYMEEMLAATLAAAPAGSSARHLRTRAVGLTPAADGARPAVFLADGTVLVCDGVAIAVSHERPALPFPVDGAARAHPGLVADPWRPGALSGLSPEANVVILGTGLTMVDVAAGLLARGHRRPIRAVSRRGQLPKAHGAFEPTVDVVAVWGGLPATALEGLAMVRRLTRAAAARGEDWHLAFDGTRRAAETIWRQLPVAEQRRALARLRPFWDSHRYRVAPQPGAAIDGALRDGRLAVGAASVHGLEAQGKRLAVALRPRGTAQARTLTADSVINCMGPSPDVRRTANPLVRALLDHGIAAPDPHALGLAVDGRFRLTDAACRAVPGVYAVGPITRGIFWEVIGVTEVSAHCQRLALVLAEDLALRRDPEAPLRRPAARKVAPVSLAAPTLA